MIKERRPDPVKMRKWELELALMRSRSPGRLILPGPCSGRAMLGGFLFLAAVGIFFGYYPARKAAHFDPIEALRFE